MPVILIVRPKSGPVSTLTITSKPSILGRSSSCQVKVSDDLISGKHLAVKLGSSGEVLVKDLETTNGSYLNGRQINQEKLYIGDELKIGETVLTIDPSELSTKEKRLLTREGGNNQLKFVDLKTTDPSYTKPAELAKPPVPQPKSVAKAPAKAAPMDSQTEDTVAVKSPKNFKKSEPVMPEMNMDEEIDVDQLRALQEQGELSEDEQTLLEEKIKRRVLEKSRKVDDISKRHLGSKMGKDDEEYDLEKSSGGTRMIKIDRKLSKRPKTRKELQETKIESFASKIKNIFSKNKTRPEHDADEDED